MKTSWRKIQAFSFFTSGFQANGRHFPGWLAEHPEESKLAYAMKRICDQITKIAEDVQGKFENIDIDNCATDANKVIIRNADTSLAYTQEGLKARNAARKALNETEDIEIDPHYVSELPNALKPEEIEILMGFVIKPEEEAKLTAVA